MAQDTLTTLNPLGIQDDFISAQENALLSEAGKEGLSGFVFDISESEQVTYSADITDHVVEDGSVIQDHRVIKPVNITISGFIGELVYRGSSGVSGIFSSIENRLTEIPAFTEGETPQAFQDAQIAISKAQSAALEAEAALETVTGVIGNVARAILGIGSDPTKQQIAHAKLKSLFESETLLTLQTPWNYYENLLITELSFSQMDETPLISNIKVSLKGIRKAHVKVEIPLDPRSRFGAGSSAQGTGFVDHGVVSPGGDKNIPDPPLKSLAFQGFTTLTGGSN